MNELRRKQLRQFIKKHNLNDEEKELIKDLIGEDKYNKLKNQATLQTANVNFKNDDIKHQYEPMYVTKQLLKSIDITEIIDRAVFNLEREIKENEHFWPSKLEKTNDKNIFKRSICPLCGEEDMFYVSKKSQFFNCKHCHKEGDALDFILLYYNYPLSSAIKTLVALTINDKDIKDKEILLSSQIYREILSYSEKEPLNHFTYIPENFKDKFTNYLKNDIKLSNKEKNMLIDRLFNKMTYKEISKKYKCSSPDKLSIIERKVRSQLFTLSKGKNKAELKYILKIKKINTAFHHYHLFDKVNYIKNNYNNLPEEIKTTLRYMTNILNDYYENNNLIKLTCDEKIGKLNFKLSTITDSLDFNQKHKIHDMLVKIWGDGYWNEENIYLIDFVNIDIQILLNHLDTSLIILLQDKVHSLGFKFKGEGDVEYIIKEERQDKNTLEKINIIDLKMSTRTTKCLLKEGIENLYQLKEFVRNSSPITIKGMGPKSIKEIEDIRKYNTRYSTRANWIFTYIQQRTFITDTTYIWYKKQ